MTDESHAAHGGDHGDHSPFIQHHYDDAQHQFDSGKFGIWLFLAQEVLFFSALFVAYVLYRHHHPEIYSYAHKYLDVKYGAINTAVLIFSSLTAAWAVRAAQLRQKNLLIACLTATLLCALTFLGIKYIEYSHKVHEHILFGRYFDPCVSSGGTHLLTKNNHCPGHKSTVQWDYGGGNATAGCFVDIDQEPHQEGVQAKCKVDEVTLEWFTATKLTTGGSHDCTKPKSGAVYIKGDKGTYTITGLCESILVDGDGNTVTFESAKFVAVRNNPVKPPANAPKNWQAPPLSPDKANTINGQAAGTFHGTADTRRNIPKGLTAATPTLGDVTEADIDPRKEYSRELARKPIAEQCPEVAHGHGDHGGHAQGPCWRVGFQPAVCRRDTKQNKNAFGIIVEYGDHSERGRETLIDAKCDPTPPPPTVADPLADKPQTIALGEKAMTPYYRPTTHDEHEKEAAGPPPEHTNMFFTIYFAMTGLHGIHVLVGVFVFIWLLIRAIKGQFTPDYFGPIDFAALYWHIVDLIWIFLFPLLYLIH